MNKEILNSLKVGEKTADIQEYYHGKNGKELVYKVIIYTCKSLLLFKYISKYTFPFYFRSKEFAQEFLQTYDNYEIYKYYKYNNWSGVNEFYYAIKPKGFNINKLHYTYFLLDRDEYYDTLLTSGGVWNGFIRCLDKKTNSDIGQRYIYSEIDKLEQYASKEGTTGKTFSYKLIEAN